MDSWDLLVMLLRRLVSQLFMSEHLVPVACGCSFAFPSSLTLESYPSIIIEFMEEGASASPPHVLIFPFPAQGHMNCMLKLGELLSLANINITFLTTIHNHNRLLRYTSIQSRISRYQGFQFKAIPDGLPDEHPRTVDRIMELYDSLIATAKPLLKELLTSDSFNTDSRGPVTCIIPDGILSIALEVGEDLGIPTIYFRTVSACCFWAYYSVPNLIAAGELPFNGKDMDTQVVSVKGMEGFLRLRDLPSLCRVDDLANEALQMVMRETSQTPRAKGLILNTFEYLEGPILDQIRSQVPNLYPIGPLHEHLKSRLAAASIQQSNSSNSLWEEDRSCIGWLDKQPSKSVLYVSFGSYTLVTKAVLTEFWHGLVNNSKRFLWVIRPDSIANEEGEEKITEEVWEGTKERGHIVGWAPQEEVLAHPAVVGFLTHSGWNSTLESIVAGVPMICWPYFADQQVNSRFVEEVWKIGLDMKDICDRTVIERMVRDLMEERSDEFLKRAEQMSKLAKESVSESGSSFCNLNRLINFICSMAHAGADTRS